MKIVFIIERFPSPTEYFILNEILLLEKYNYDIQIVALRKQKKFPNIPDLKKLKAEIHYIPLFHFYFPIVSILRSLKCLIAFLFSIDNSIVRYNFKFLKSIRYFGISQYLAKRVLSCDHIHAHFAFIPIDIAYYLSKELKVDYSVTVHSQDIYTNADKIKEHLPRLKFLITCTEYNRSFLNFITSNSYRSKIHRVYHGINLEKWLLPNSNFKRTGKIQLLTIARLVEKKGLVYLIHAIEGLVKCGISVNCLIIGEGQLQSKLEDIIAIKKLNKFINIVPFVSQNELKSYYRKADFFILPSIISSNGDRDGLPNVIVEAMICGVPVISTPVSAIPEVIKHKETGILVKSMSSQSIIEGIKWLIENPELSQQIAENAKKLIKKKLDINTCIMDFVEILK